MFNPEALMIGISLCPLPNKDNYRYLKKTVYVGGASEEGERNVRIFLFFSGCIGGCWWSRAF